MQSNRDLVRVADSNPTENALTFSTGVHYNALHLSPNEEYELFRRKNHVAESYRGPVYVAEDVQVPCAECGCPVDPITRVPVSDCTSHRVYFHPECIKCAICKCNDLTLNYFMVYDVHRNREPTVACARCVYNGYVSLDEPLRRNKHGVSNKTNRQHHNYNSYNSSSSNKIMYNKTGRHTNKGKYTNLYCSQSNTVNKNSINLPCLPGCTPASLSIKGSMHTPHNTTPRAIALIHRQQYYTQNDCNLLMHPPISEEDNERVNEDERRRNTTNYNDQQDSSECSNPPHTNPRLKESNEPSAARLHNEKSMSTSEQVHKRRSTLPKIEQQL